MKCGYCNRPVEIDLSEPGGFCDDGCANAFYTEQRWATMDEESRLEKKRNEEASRSIQKRMSARFDRHIRLQLGWDEHDEQQDNDEWEKTLLVHGF